MAVRAFRLIVPSVWLGLLIALAFVETPLKFLAPGMTLEVALGVGRLVLTAADIAGVVLLAVITVLALPRPRVPRAGLIVLGALWVVLLAQVAIVRPLLNARTDVILSGGDPGESSLHVVYIAADLLLVAGLVAFLVTAARQRCSLDRR